MSRQAYPKYKPSGIEWLGEIPAGWITVSVKRKYAIQLGKMLQNNPESDADVSVPYIKALHVNWGKVNTSDLPEMWANPAEIGQFGVKSGDLLVCEGGEAGRAGIVSTLPTPCIIQNALHRVRGKDADVRFLQYVFHAVGSGGWFEVLCNKATIAHFTREKLAELRMPLPLNIDEQRAIAAFLDRETARIDALIEKKQRQIELLREKRTALISHAVTKGLNPNVKMKDSGIEWLGEIPEHWRCLQIKRLSLVKRGASPRPIDDPKYFDEEGKYSWVRIADVTASTHYLEVTTQRLSPLGKSLSVPLEPGAIFLSIAGSVGKPIITKVKCCIHDGFVYFPQFKGNPEFLYYIFASGQPYGGLGKLGTQLNLNTDTVGAIKIGYPAEDEQRAIAAFLDRETANLDAMIEKINKSLELLREYRTALISAAVTGKIDVREEVS